VWLLVRNANWGSAAAGARGSSCAPSPPASNSTSTRRWSPSCERPRARSSSSGRPSRPPCRRRRERWSPRKGWSPSWFRHIATHDATFWRRSSGALNRILPRRRWLEALAELRVDVSAVVLRRFRKCDGRRGRGLLRRRAERMGCATSCSAVPDCGVSVLRLGATAWCENRGGAAVQRGTPTEAEVGRCRRPAAR
jgi:hypothetical protein